MYVNFHLLVLFHLIVLHLILTASIRKIFNSDAMFFVSTDLYLKFLKFSHCYAILMTNSSSTCEFLTPILFWTLFSQPLQFCQCFRLQDDYQQTSLSLVNPYQSLPAHLTPHPQDTPKPVQEQQQQERLKIKTGFSWRSHGEVFIYSILN
jgi:hypothetical protein